MTDLGRGGWAAGAAAGLVCAVVVAVLAGPASPAVGASLAATGTTPAPTGSATSDPTPTPDPTATADPTATPTPTPTATAGDDLLRPDVIALPANDLSVQSTSAGRRLRFASSLGNLGPGVLEIRPNRAQPCPPGQHHSTQVLFRDRNGNDAYNRFLDTQFVRRPAGCMVFHPSHDHWHFMATARYTLLERGTEERVVVSTRRKVSFCLRDSDRLPVRYGSWSHPMTYGACRTWSPQGIAVGWMDIYQSFLAGQSLPLPRRLADGVYCLETVVDPLGQLVEADDTNNRSVRAVAIRGTRAVPRPTRMCR